MQRRNISVTCDGQGHGWQGRRVHGLVVTGWPPGPGCICAAFRGHGSDRSLRYRPEPGAVLREGPARGGAVPREPPVPMARGFGPLQLALAAAGTAATALDVCADGWVAAGYARGGRPGLAALVVALRAAGSVATQACSWLWLRSDPPALRPAAPPALLAALHLLQLGFLFRCLHVLKVGWKVCRAEEDGEEQSHMAFLCHDISMLRLFETFLENTPQLTLLLCVVLQASKAEPAQGLGLCTAFLCVTWSLLDYHQSLRSFLQDKYELRVSSSIIYFLWNLLLICPRILTVALFSLLWPYAVAVHFPLVWLAMFLWVSLQGTDFMESPGPEQLYRAMVAVILYFSWFNVSQGRTLHRSIIYHSFILVDSMLLALSWLWCRFPSDEHSYLIPVVFAALPCYLLGLALRVTYYKWLHPSLRAQEEGSFDEVDANGTSGGMELPSPSEPDLVNRRMRWLIQTQFSISWPVGQQFLNGAAAVESAA